MALPSLSELLRSLGIDPSTVPSDGSVDLNAILRDLGALPSGIDTTPVQDPGAATNDVVYGGFGNDPAVMGTNGDDIIDGGGGADTMIGFNGNDVYRVDNTGDVAAEGSGAGTGTDTVIATVSYSLPNNVEALYISGTGLTGTGSAGN